MRARARVQFHFLFTRFACMHAQTGERVVLVLRAAPQRRRTATTTTTAVTTTTTRRECIIKPRFYASIFCHPRHPILHEFHTSLSAQRRRAPNSRKFPPRRCSDDADDTHTAAGCYCCVAAAGVGARSASAHACCVISARKVCTRMLGKRIAIASAAVAHTPLSSRAGVL